MWQSKYMHKINKLILGLLLLPALIFAQDGDACITVQECAMKANTIVYEMTSGIGPRVARVFKMGDQVVKIRTLLERWGNHGC